MLSFLLKFTLVSNPTLPFQKLLVSEFLLGISESLHCSMSAPHVKIDPLLDMHQLIMLFAGALKYSEPRTVSLFIYLIIFIINIIITSMYECYPFSPRNGITIANVLQMYTAQFRYK
jgi:hypothetical protein